MKILLANPRGFCAGVHMAIDVVDQLLELCPDEPLYVYHEIVHNKHVVGRFEARGVRFIEDVSEVPGGCKVVFSAHGVSPAVRQAAEQRGVVTIDATCPLVTKVHMEAIRYAKKGFQLLLIGHANHQEVIGTRGEAPEATQVVECPEDIPHLTIHDPTKLVYLTQTTLSTDDAAVIISALEETFPEIKAPPTSDICYATTNRQHAVRALAPACDLTIVIGSVNSSNSQRLREISENVGTTGRLVDDVGELDDAWFDGVERVLITAGASAPEDLVAAICRYLVEHFDAELEVQSLVDEDIDFDLPATLKRLMRDRGVAPEDKRIRFTRPEITSALYGTTAVTVSAPSQADGMGS